MLTSHELQQLINRYCQGSCTPQEAAEVESWYNYMSQHSDFPEADVFLPDVKQQIWANIANARQRVKRQRTPYYLKYAAVAATALLISGSFYFRYWPGL